MKTYSYSVKDLDFPEIFEGEIEAESPEQAKQYLIEDYCMELGTDESSLTITLKEVTN